MANIDTTCHYTIGNPISGQLLQSTANGIMVNPLAGTLSLFARQLWSFINWGGSYLITNFPTGRALHLDLEPWALRPTATSCFSGSRATAGS